MTRITVLPPGGESMSANYEITETELDVMRESVLDHQPVRRGNNPYACVCGFASGDHEDQTEHQFREAATALASARDSRIRTEAAREALDGLIDLYKREASTCAPGGHAWNSRLVAADTAREYRDVRHAREAR